MTRPFYSLEHYAKRLDRVLEYIDANLAHPLRLSVLADQASFSPSHFHNIFCEWLGETPQCYIRRRRLERSAALLHYGPDTAVMDIAPVCGFTSVQAFDRAFHVYFGMTPTKWRSGGFSGWHENSLPSTPVPEHLSNDQIQLKHLPSIQILYKRKVGSYKEGEAELWDRLSGLIESSGLNGQPCFGIGLDDPRVTPMTRCRFDACVELPKSISVSANTPVKPLPGGLHAVLPYNGLAGESEGHWIWLLQTWLPQSGYQVSQHPCFERYPKGIPAFGGPVHSELHLPLVR